MDAHDALTEDTILIVTGSDLRAEECDRPLAYAIQQVIQENHGDRWFRPVYVISDVRYLYDRDYRNCSAISVGGPGVNALADRWLEELPAVLVADDEIYIQLSDESEHPPRASVWGMTRQSTKMAVATFLRRYLDEFLREVAHSSGRG